MTAVQTTPNECITENKVRDVPMVKNVVKKQKQNVPTPTNVALRLKHVIETRTCRSGTGTAVLGKR